MKLNLPHLIRSERNVVKSHILHNKIHKSVCCIGGRLAKCKQAAIGRTGICSNKSIWQAQKGHGLRCEIMNAVPRKIYSNGNIFIGIHFRSHSQRDHFIRSHGNIRRGVKGIACRSVLTEFQSIVAAPRISLVVDVHADKPVFIDKIHKRIGRSRHTKASKHGVLCYAMQIGGIVGSKINPRVMRNACYSV